MSCRISFAIPFVMLCSAISSQAVAQSDPSRVRSNSYPVNYSFFEAVESESYHNFQQTMAEDTEVMRRLLDNALNELFPGDTSRADTSMPMGGLSSLQRASRFEYWYRSAGRPTSTRRGRPSSGGIQIRELLGTYLNGHGVVYQLELPPLRAPAEPVAKITVAHCPVMSLSEWERTRKHLSGELKKNDCRSCHDASSTKSKTTDPLNSAADFLKSAQSQADANLYMQFMNDYLKRTPDAGPTRQDLTDRLIGLLAENGHHFQALPADQRITVAVTFRKPQPGPAARSYMSGMMDEMMGSYGMPGMEGGLEGGIGFDSPGAGADDAYGGGYEAGGGGDAGYGAGFDDDSAAKSSDDKKSDDISTKAAGDGVYSIYYRKQGSSSAKPGNEELAGDLNMRQGNIAKAIEAYDKALRNIPVESSRRVRQKLAQALIASGRLDKAKTILDELLQESNKKQADQITKQQEAYSLPARLIVSVTKSNLDAVAAGKLSREEFRKSVSVDYFDPAASKPAKGEGDQIKN